MVLFITLHKVILTVKFVGKSRALAWVTIQMKAAGQFLYVELFIMLYTKCLQLQKPVDKLLLCDYSNASCEKFFFFQVELFVMLWTKWFELKSPSVSLVKWKLNMLSSAFLWFCRVTPKLALKSVDETPVCVNFYTKADEQYFHMVRFIAHYCAKVYVIIFCSKLKLS